jgi:hypothetical protein
MSIAVARQTAISVQRCAADIDGLGGAKPRTGAVAGGAKVVVTVR